MPIVSVLMPCYNSEQYIREAIDSILSQTFSDFEFIVINDGSTDNSAEIIGSYKDKRIKYINNDVNLGLIKSLNKGISLAKGKYIARMDSDDISYPTRLKEQVIFLDNHPDVIMCGTWINFFNYPPRKDDGHHQTDITYLSLLKGWCINHPTVMMRTDVIKKNNLFYDENYPCAEDYELWSRLIRYGKIVNLQKVLLDYRWHENNISVVKQKKMQETVQKIQQNMLDFLSLSKEEQEKIKKLIYTNEKNSNKESKFYFCGLPFLTIRSCVND